MYAPTTNHWDAFIDMRYVMVFYMKTWSFANTRFRIPKWVGSPFNSKTTTWCFVQVVDNRVSWKNKQQDIIPTFNPKAENRVMAQTTFELV